MRGKTTFLTSTKFQQLLKKKKNSRILTAVEQEQHHHFLPPLSPSPPIKKKKTNRDVNQKIKRPMNSFLFFSLSKREELKRNNPRLINKEICELLGKMWKGMNAREKAPFVLQAKKAREKFKKEHPGFKFTKSPRKSRKKDFWRKLKMGWIFEIWEASCRYIKVIFSLSVILFHFFPLER